MTEIQYAVLGYAVGLLLFLVYALWILWECHAVELREQPPGTTPSG